jgi:hypothetical protein
MSFLQLPSLEANLSLAAEAAPSAVGLFGLREAIRGTMQP